MFNIIFLLFLKSLSIYNNLTDKTLLSKNLKIRCSRTFFTYTNFGFICFFIVEILKKYNIIFNNLNLTTIVILTTTTIGYWLVVYPNLTINQKNDKFGIISDILGHGPPLILFLLDNTFKIETINKIIYPLISSYFWFIFIWFPWYIITKDPLYNSLSNKLSLLTRCKTILNINIINILSFFSLYLIN